VEELIRNGELEVQTSIKDNPLVWTKKNK